jgi:hypothetical protein
MQGGYKAMLLGSVQRRASNIRHQRDALGLRSRDPEETVKDSFSPQKVLSKRARLGLKPSVAGSGQPARNYGQGLKEASQSTSTPFKSPRRMSPVKEQYQDFKIKFGIMDEVNADIQISPEAAKSKFYSSLTHLKERQKFKDMQTGARKRGIPMENPEKEWARTCATSQGRQESPVKSYINSNSRRAA